MEYRRKDTLFWILSMAFVVLLILSNIIANRLIVVGGLLLPSAIIVFPLTYIIGDVVTEIFGFKKMRNLIIASLLMNCIFVVLGLLAVSLPAPSGADNISAYYEVFSIAPRVTFASMCGFFVGSISNAFVMDKMKNSERLQKSLFSRIFASTIVGEFLDTCLFISIVFLGTLGMGTIVVIIAVQFTAKIAYETLFSPVTIAVIRKIKTS